MPSDIVLGKNFVLVEDPSGTYLERCDFYIVRWSSRKPSSNLTTTSIDDIVNDYFGDEHRLVHGSVDIPKGPWQRVCEVAFIRYRRAGYASGDYEHPYDPPVVLFQNEGVPAFKLALPSGCVVDDRGFVTP